MTLFTDFHILSVSHPLLMQVCPCCQIPQARQFCSACLQEGVASHVQWAQALRSQCTAAIARANKNLIGQASSRRGIDEWRKLRADIAASERRCAQLRLGILEHTRGPGKASSTSSGVVTRRADSVSSQFKSQELGLRRSLLINVDRKVQEVSRRIVHARRVLVKEAIGVFGLHHRPLGGWEIAGMPLSDPRDFTVFSATSINAAISHVIHLVNLITRYLSIALPFIPTFPHRQHVGRPSMRANLPFTNTTKFRDRPALWMSSTTGKVDARSRHKYRQFLSAYGLLSHSVSYLAWTQGVEGVGVSQARSTSSSSSETEEMRSSSILIPASSVLQLLYALARSKNLGIRSHEPGTGPLYHLGFSLDVRRVVIASLGSEFGGMDAAEPSEDWDMVDGTVAS